MKKNDLLLIVEWLLNIDRSVLSTLSLLSVCVDCLVNTLTKLRYLEHIIFKDLPLPNVHRARLDNVPKLRKVIQDSALFQVVGHHSTAWWQTGLNIGLHTQTTFHCLLGQKSCKKNEHRQWFAEPPVPGSFFKCWLTTNLLPTWRMGCWCWYSWWLLQWPPSHVEGCIQCH